MTLQWAEVVSVSGLGHSLEVRVRDSRDGKIIEIRSHAPHVSGAELLALRPGAALALRDILNVMLPPGPPK